MESQDSHYCQEVIRTLPHDVREPTRGAVTRCSSQSGIRGGLLGSLKLHLPPAIMCHYSPPRCHRKMNGAWGSTTLPSPMPCQRKPAKLDDLNIIQSLLIIFKISRIHLKITLIPRTKKILTERKRLTNTDTEMTQVLELSSKDFKAATAKRNVFTNNYHHAWNKWKTISSFSKEMEVIKNQMEILKLKNTTIKIKNF